MLEKSEILLTQDQLKTLWTAARKYSLEEFNKQFSTGLPPGIEQSQKNIDQTDVLLRLQSHCIKGDYENFTKLFEKNEIDVNINFLDKDFTENYTFLRLLIDYDTLPANEPKTKERIKLAKYLIDNSADMNVIPIEDCTRNSLPSCLDLAKYHQHPGFFSRITSILSITPGANIFPILIEQANKLQLNT